jgi:hypothetical protein
MIKKFKTFINEKLGISSNVEEECNRIFDEIHRYKKQKQYYLFYKNDIGAFPILLIHNPKLNQEGYFQGSMDANSKPYNCIIGLKSLDDKSTLFHELKHLDYYIKNKNSNKEVIKKYYDNIDAKSKKYDIIKNILYVFGENEFQSKYHDLYFNFNEYIKTHISDNPSSKEIIQLFNSFLTSYKDKTFTWYLKQDELKFRDYLKEDELYYCFYHLINDGYLSKILDIYTELRSYLVYLNLNKHQLFSNKEKEKINKFISDLEKYINNKTPIYRKKVMRLISLMTDKWVK